MAFTLKAKINDAALTARFVVREQAMKKEKAMQALSNELDMWSFYEAGDWPVAKTSTDFIWFLLSPSTQSIEIVSFDYDHITFALYGPPGEDGIPGVVLKTLERHSTHADERKLIVAAINESYPGSPCEKARMARTVATFFDVPWTMDLARAEERG